MNQKKAKKCRQIARQYYKFMVQQWMAQKPSRWRIFAYRKWKKQEPLKPRIIRDKKSGNVGSEKS